MTILIVDDSTFARYLLKKIIEQCGYNAKFIEANDGCEAVEKYKQNLPDLVFMDITMNNMDGITAVKKIKEYDTNCKIIMCTAMSQTPFIQEAYLNGALDFIVKPIDPQKLKEIMKKIKPQ